MTEEGKRLNPGSREALEKGCTCPILDNNHGRGIGRNKEGKLMFWYAYDCPLHGDDDNGDTESNRGA